MYQNPPIQILPSSQGIPQCSDWTEGVQAPNPSKDLSDLGEIIWTSKGP